MKFFSAPSSSSFSRETVVGSGGNTRQSVSLLRSHPRILLIEDQGYLRQMYAMLLTKEGYSVEEAATGNEAWKILSMAGDLPDLVISDIILPGLTGYDLLRKIRSDKRLAHVPVWVLTNLNTNTDEKKSLELGADRYLTKIDTTPRDLVNHLQHAFQNVRQR